MRTKKAQPFNLRNSFLEKCSDRSSTLTSLVALAATETVGKLTLAIQTGPVGYLPSPDCHASPPIFKAFQGVAAIPGQSSNSRRTPPQEANRPLVIHDATVQTPWTWSLRHIHREMGEEPKTADRSSSEADSRVPRIRPGTTQSDGRLLTDSLLGICHRHLTAFQGAPRRSPTTSSSLLDRRRRGKCHTQKPTVEPLNPAQNQRPK